MTPFAADWWRAAHAIAQTGRQIDAALLHSNTARATFYTTLAARRAGLVPALEPVWTLWAL